ncbi:hypothetical protein ARMSODRAFT_719335 [Armillaria solidipes]|uniref:Uncharacterized protein n=1 Tax=Armillaria solidipes TaxID=1076256 RepID=A0A2H3C4D3_9AGAR|nr:hypothetical protein ARMSODRAFT_719335 [Armillaria solidipes]
MRNTPSRIVDQPLPRRIKSVWKRLRAVFSTRRARKDSSPDATSNSDQNVDGIAPSDSHEDTLYENISDNGGPISEAIPDSLSEVGPADEHPSGQSSQTSDDSDPESYWEPEYNTLPKVTISATIETGQAESSIKVPKQRKYTGRRPVIPSSLADIPCATLGVQGVLDRLNATLGTSHTLDTPSVLSVLEDCIVKNYDFGTAYGRLRGVWNRNNIEDELRACEERDKEGRREALVGDDLMEWGQWTPPPRRVWDLCSNRVVPWWIRNGEWGEWLWPISHAWVDEKDRTDVWTPINGKEWPVPIPKDINLNLIRIEMLNMGVTYTWLDVLCLRQKGGPREDLRAEEWKLDVPTIGYVYRYARIVIYLSGLGRPLSLKEGDLESDRCWFRRAWTLQEVGHTRIIAGDTPDGPMHAEPVDNNGNYETEMLTSFHKQLKHRWNNHLFPLFGPLAHMRNRVSTNPVDRVAGLTFCLEAQRAAYHESETLEDAWTALVNAMNHDMRARILFLYPGVGLGCKKWRPMWEQVMTEPLPADDVYCRGFVDCDDETDKDWCEGPCIEQGFVRGLNTGSAEGVDRCGELVVKDADGMQYTFKIRVTHQFPIPEGAYTLLGSFTTEWGFKQAMEFWVVGRSLPDRRFEKLSVIRIPDERRLNQCGIVQWGLERIYLL